MLLLGLLFVQQAVEKSLETGLLLRSLVALRARQQSVFQSVFEAARGRQENRIRSLAMDEKGYAFGLHRLGNAAQVTQQAA